MVEKVLDKRTGKAGRDEFLIQWQGFPESDSSWEPRENLQCVEMLDEFEREFSKVLKNFLKFILLEMVLKSEFHSENCLKNLRFCPLFRAATV